MARHDRDRLAMVDDLRARGIEDQRVLAAMAEVPRHRFVPGSEARRAYSDHALPLSRGQTISQPFVVAWMAEALLLKPDDRVLEVGAGSGYAAAVMAKLAHSVIAVERIPSLASGTQELLTQLGVTNVEIVVGDGSQGWAESAPFDAISVAAAAPRVPDVLVDQLATGGRLVIPVAVDESREELTRVTKERESVATEVLGGVRFVPLIGEEGYLE